MSIRSLSGRLFALPSMVSVASVLRWGDLPNTAPPTTVLVSEGLVGFAAKTKNVGKSEGRPWGEAIMYFYKRMDR